MDKMKEETRLLLAFIISIFIIFIFSRSRYSQYRPEIQKIEKTYEIEKGKLETSEGEKFEFENSDYIIKIDRKLGIIKEIGLKKFLRKGEKFFPICEISSFFLNPELLNEKDFDIKVEGNTLILSKEKNGLIFKKTYIIPERDYIFSYKESIKNETKESKFFENFGIEIMRIKLSDLRIQKPYTPSQIIVSIGQVPVFLDPLRLREEKNYKNCKWAGLISKNSLVFIYLGEKSNVSILRENDNIVVKYSEEKFELKGNEEKAINFKFYAGPSDYFIARNYIKEDIFGKGIFAICGRFLFSVLNGIHKVIPNWGWSIIILTFIIKILFFPLTKKSLYSMKQLQKLRPYLQDIQKKYKDNPMQLQKELMNIYKEYNINPFAGCLPTIIQIPIFIGFFLALRNSVFLRGAPFILWIKDLSMPDTVYKIGQFPINILPILMTITSYFQQKLTPQTDPSQKSLTIIMPLLFLFILYNFPSGLLLYWVTMNIGSLIEQFIITKNIQKQGYKKV